MKFYCFGDKTNPPIMLFPGTWCLHTSFSEVIPLLEKSFYVIAVSYDGFDETEDTVFPDMMRETEKIETYIKENLGGMLFAAYGCSLGGSFVGLLVQRKNIHIEHGFIGSSDLDQSGKVKAWFMTKLFGGMMVKMLQTGEYPWYMKKGFEKNLKTEYGRKFYEMLGIGKGGYPFIKKASAENQFYSDLITPLEEQISADGTTIHIFYAKKMGEEYLERYNRHFRNPHIVVHDLRHEELLICYPENGLMRLKIAVLKVTYSIVERLYWNEKINNISALRNAWLYSYGKRRLAYDIRRCFTFGRNILAY